MHPSARLRDDHPESRRSLADSPAKGPLMRLMGWTDWSMLDLYGEDLQVERAFEAKRRCGDVY